MTDAIPIDFIPGNKLSYATTRIEVLCNDNVISFGTGFVLKYAKTYGLVTNWHVLSGRNPITGGLLSKHAAIPDKIKFHVTVVTQECLADGRLSTTLYFKPIQMALQNNGKNIWGEITKNGYIIDVALIPLNDIVEELNEKNTILAHIDANKVTLKRDFKPKKRKRLTNVTHENLSYYYPSVGKDVFILGYPRGVELSGVFPIWKRGSVASEPQASISSNGHKYDNLIYVDALIKEGMSGAPVIVLPNKGDIFVTDDGTNVEARDNEPHFVGVYAGRDGVTQEEYEFSIGRVWKAQTVTELFIGIAKAKSQGAT
jgi:Trypsin-like peptidase domain